MSTSDSQRIPYHVRDGVLRINGVLKYQDRELRLATMMLLNSPQAAICIDASRVPSLCSPEIQFFAKMAESAKQRGKKLRLRLSKGAHEMVRDLEVSGIIEVEEVETQEVPGSKNPTPPPKPVNEIIEGPWSRFLKKKLPPPPPKL